MLGQPPHITLSTQIDDPPEAIGHIFLNPTEVMESPGKTRHQRCTSQGRIDTDETGSDRHE